MKKFLAIFLITQLIDANVHLKTIKDQFKRTKDENIYNLNIKQFIQFYENGDFNNQVKSICNNALSFFGTYPKNHNTAIIFDIDETILSNYPICKEKNFEWSLDNDVTPYREKAICPAITPVLEFYHQLIKYGFKVIFLTSRRFTLYEATFKNLKEKGIHDFELLILLPMDKFEAGVNHAQWKAQVRKELSSRYTISGSVSDSQKDFEGGNVGYKVKLPNYLY